MSDLCFRVPNEIAETRNYTRVFASKKMLNLFILGFMAHQVDSALSSKVAKRPYIFMKSSTIMLSSSLLLLVSSKINILFYSLEVLAQHKKMSVIDGQVTVIGFGLSTCVDAWDSIISDKRPCICTGRVT